MKRLVLALVLAAGLFVSIVSADEDEPEATEDSESVSSDAEQPGPYVAKKPYGLVVQQKGMYGYTEDEVADCLTLIFENNEQIPLKRIETPEKTDRLSLFKWAKAKDTAGIVLVELRPGAPPVVLAQSVDAASFANKVASRAVDSGSGRACDAAFWVITELFDAPSETQVQGYMTLGAKAQQRGDINAAASYYGMAMDADPSDPMPVRLLGRLTQTAGDLETARLWYDQAIGMRRADAATYAEAGLCNLAAGERERGMDLLDKAIGRGARIPHLYTTVGDYLYETENFGSAAEHYLDAARLDPRGFSSYTLLVDSLAREHRWAEAAQYQDVVVKANPTYEGLLLLAEYRENAEDFDNAAVVLKSLVQSNPDDPDLRKRLGQALDKSGHPDEAAAVFNQVLEQNPNDADVWMALGSLHYKKKDFPAAINAFEQARALSPGDPRTLRLEAMARELSGDVDGALRNYADALMLDRGVKESDVARYLLLSKKHDRMSEAVTTIQSELPYKDVEDRRTMVMALGQRLVEDGENERAIALYSASIESLGRFAPPRVALGDLYLRQGDWQKAAATFMAATSIFSDPQIPLYAAVKYRQARQWELAKTFFNYSFGINSQNITCVSGLAEVSLYLGDNPDVVNYYFNEAANLPKTPSTNALMEFLQILWGLRYNEAEFAHKVLAYALQERKQSLPPALDLSDWTDWMARELSDEAVRALGGDAQRLYENKLTPDAFLAAHPEFAS